MRQRKRRERSPAVERLSKPCHAKPKLIATVGIAAPRASYVAWLVRLSAGGKTVGQALEKGDRPEEQPPCRSQCQRPT